MATVRYAKPIKISEGVTKLLYNFGTKTEIKFPDCERQNKHNKKLSGGKLTGIYTRRVGTRLWNSLFHYCSRNFNCLLSDLVCPNF